MISPTIDLVLPLHPKHLDRFERVLQPTLGRFFPSRGTLWIVVPDGDVAEIRSRVTLPDVEVLSEKALVPEIATAQAELASQGSIGGWLLQQLLKLSAARVVRSPFYLTLDADVMVVQPVRPEAFMVGERGRYSVADQVWNDGWSQWSERVLGPPYDPAPWAITPALFSREAMLRLLGWIELQHPGRAEGWLLRNFPWTEYGLYATWLRRYGLMAEYHAETTTGWIVNSVWDRKQVDTWNPGPSFRPRADDAFFTVLQSTQVDDLEAMIERIRAWHAAERLPSPI